MTQVLSDVVPVARQAAAFIAEEARKGVSSRGRFVVAVSGGHTSWLMLHALAREKLPWECVHIVQTDELMTGENDPDRSLPHLRRSLVGNCRLPADQIYPMPVETQDAETAISQYTQTLVKLAGTPPVLDLIQLILGSDGHAAALLPEDPVLDVADAEVAMTVPSAEGRRMTLTFPVLNRARRVLWIVTGTEKADMFARLRNADISIPAGRVRYDRAFVLADCAAAGQLVPR